MLIDTVVPWVLGTLLLLTLLTLTNSIRSWRDLKRSPFFFMRRQAEKRLQTYASTSLVLMLATAVFTAYAWQAPADTTPRVALLTNAKPPKEETIALLEGTSLSASAPPVTIESTVATVAAPANPAFNFASDEAAAQATPELPGEYDQFDPTAELRENTELGALAFSTNINENYEAVSPGRIFAEGFYTLYATFAYQAMTDGMEWAWVWRHNGAVVDGGNELWAYGDEGPGYIYFNPKDGFKSGQYSLEVWVNGQLLSNSSVIINTAALSAGN